MYSSPKTYMNLILSILLLCCCTCGLAQPAQVDDFHRLRDREKLLQTLDKALELRQFHIDSRQHEIDTLKSRLETATSNNERQVLYSNLYNRYGSYRTDSAFVYAKRAYDLALLYGTAADKQHTSIDLAYCYCLSGLYQEGHSLMPERSEVLPEVLLNYYIAQCSFFQWQSEFTTIPQLKEELYKKSMAYHDSILLTDPNPLHQIQERVQIVGMMSRPEAIATLENAMAELPGSEDYIRYMALMTGNIFMELQQPDSAAVFYTISAISDMQHGVLEHAALQRLATLLFKQGDVKRAYQYMNCCLKDAEVSGARLRFIELQGNIEIIMSAYNSQIVDQNKQLLLVLGIIIILLIVVILVSINLNKVRKHLKKKGEQLLTAHNQLTGKHNQLEAAMQKLQQSSLQLEKANLSLQESNRIKDSFVTEYMKQCRAGISKLQNYQQMLQRLAVTHNTDRLLETIKNAENIEPLLEAFYEDFDETFLNLYPKFISELNSQLRPEEQYAITQHLPTELRVFALMRLGVTDLDEIATFLRCAPKTVLNYRSRLRQKAIIDKDELDKIIISGKSFE